MSPKTQSAENEIRALFAAYGAGFDDADVDVVTSLFAWPTTIWQAGKGHVFADAEELAENVEALIDVFDEAGIKSTIPEVREVHVAGAAAFAHVLWRQMEDSGEVLHQFTCQYLLLNEGSEWLIATVVNEAAASQE